MPRLPRRRLGFVSNLVRALLTTMLLVPAATPAIALSDDFALLMAIDKEKLKPGHFWWFAEVDDSASLLIVVSLPQQRAYVYRSGALVAVSSISSGRKGYSTPTGTFTILERKRKHISNLYDAPMPFMLRLTWDGIALHGGDIPGYRASHGCIRLPMAFSRALFAVSPAVETVIVTDAEVVEGMFDRHAMANLQ
jgi:hypothetical protein